MTLQNALNRTMANCGISEQWNFDALPKNYRGKYILSTETLRQLDPYYTPPVFSAETFLANALHQVLLLAQIEQTGQSGKALPNSNNQGTTRSQPPRVQASRPSRLRRNSPFYNILLHLNLNITIFCISLNTHNLEVRTPGDMKHQVYLKTFWHNEYPTSNSLMLSLEPQTPPFVFFRQQIFQSPKQMLPSALAALQVKTPNSTMWNPQFPMFLPTRTLNLHLTSLLLFHTFPWLINLPSTNFPKTTRLIEYTKPYTPLLFRHRRCPISLLTYDLFKIWVISLFHRRDCR